MRHYFDDLSDVRDRVSGYVKRNETQFVVGIILASVILATITTLIVIRCIRVKRLRSWLGDDYYDDFDDDFDDDDFDIEITANDDTAKD